MNTPAEQGRLPNSSSVSAVGRPGRVKHLILGTVCGLVLGLALAASGPIASLMGATLPEPLADGAPIAVGLLAIVVAALLLLEVLPAVRHARREPSAAVEDVNQHEIRN